jgi:hypothetical protein
MSFKTISSDAHFNKLSNGIFLNDIEYNLYLIE